VHWLKCLRDDIGAKSGFSNIIQQPQLERFCSGLHSTIENVTTILCIYTYIMAQQSFNIFRLSTSSLMEIKFGLWPGKVWITCRTIGMEL
jgi:hypothetical protein